MYAWRQLLYIYMSTYIYRYIYTPIYALRYIYIYQHFLLAMFSHMRKIFDSLRDILALCTINAYSNASLGIMSFKNLYRSGGDTSTKTGSHEAYPATSHAPARSDGDTSTKTGSHEAYPATSHAPARGVPLSPAKNFMHSRDHLGGRAKAKHVHQHLCAHTTLYIRIYSLHAHIKRFSTYTYVELELIYIYI